MENEIVMYATSYVLFRLAILASFGYVVYRIFRSQRASIRAHRLCDINLRVGIAQRSLHVPVERVVQCRLLDIDELADGDPAAKVDLHVARWSSAANVGAFLVFAHAIQS